MLFLMCNVGPIQLGNAADRGSICYTPSSLPHWLGRSQQVFILSFFSLLGAVFGLFRVIRVIQFAKREIRATNRATNNELKQAAKVVRRNKSLNVNKANVELTIAHRKTHPLFVEGVMYDA